MTTNMKVLIEQISPADGNLIQESTNDGKNLWLTGVVMQADIKNRNGRLYPLQEISKAVKHSQFTIKENQMMGELDHPSGLQINLDRVSHLITQLDMQGSNAVGRLKILDTPCGRIAKSLIESGVRVACSSRGAGNVNDTGLVEGFMLTTIDLVATPSAPGAVPSSIYESLQGNVHGQRALTLAEEVAQDEAAQKYLKKEILRFLNEGLFAKK